MAKVYAVKCENCQAEMLIKWPVSHRKYCPECARKMQRQHCHDYNIHRSEKSGRHCGDCNRPIAWKNKTGYCKMCLNRNHRSGPNCPSWKGGRKGDKDGYIFIYHPDPHPHRIETCKNKSGQRSTYYVAEHILNWEKYNKQPLPEGYTVHHLNGIRSDNRPKNLVALPTPRHSSGLVNKALQSRIRELEAIIAQGKLDI